MSEQKTADEKYASEVQRRQEANAARMQQSEAGLVSPRVEVTKADRLLTRKAQATFFAKTCRASAEEYQAGDRELARLLTAAAFAAELVCMHINRRTEGK